MKKLSLLFIAFSSFAVFAQEKENRSEKATEKLDKIVQLTAEQKIKVSNINNEAFNCIKSTKENSTLNEEQKKEQIKSCRKKKKSDLKAVLTNEQLQKLKDAAKKHRDNKKSPNKKSKPSENQELEILEEM